MKGGEVMSTATVMESRAKGEETMTDYQFKTILKMVLDIAENTNDVEKIKKSLKELIYGENKNTNEE